MSLNAAIDKIAAVDRLEPGRIHRPELLSDGARRQGHQRGPGGTHPRRRRPMSSRSWLATPGAWVVDQLEARGIRGWFVRVDGETRTCLSVLDRASGELTEFYEPGLVLPDDRWASVEAALGDALADRPAASVVLLAGSLPPGAPPDAYRRLAAQASGAGARVVVDIGGAPLTLALEARPWLVKINAAEASATTGLPTTDRDEVRRGRSSPHRGGRRTRARHDGRRGCRARHADRRVERRAARRRSGASAWGAGTR